MQSEVSKARVQILGLFRQHQEEMNEVIATFVATRLSGTGQVRMRARVVASAAMGAYLAASREWLRSAGTEDMSAPHRRGPRSPAQRAGGRTRLTAGPASTPVGGGRRATVDPSAGADVVVVVAAFGVTLSRSITKTSASFLAMSPCPVAP